MDQTVRLFYMGDSPALKTQRPYMVGPGFMKTIPLCNYRLEAGPPQVIRDVRGGADGEKAFHLAEQGFSFRPWHPTEIDWDDEGQIERTYLPEVKELLREELGLGDAFKRCEVFDWRLRSGGSAQRFTNIEKGRMKKIRPAEAVHIDQSAAGAFDRLNLLLPRDEVDELTAKYRVQIFNIWRPIRGVVEQWPLCVCDARTVTLDDLDELEYITEEYVRSSYLAKWSDRFRFYYQSKMSREDVCIFKIFDSAYHDPDGRRSTVGCPHAAFKIDGVTSAPPRESIEARVFVFSEQ